MINTAEQKNSHFLLIKPKILKKHQENGTFNYNYPVHYRMGRKVVKSHYFKKRIFVMIYFFSHFK